MSGIDLERSDTFVDDFTDGIDLAIAECIIASGGQDVLRDADSSAIKSAPAKFDNKARGRTVVLIDKASVHAAAVAAKEVANRKEVARRLSLSHAGEGS